MHYLEVLKFIRFFKFVYNYCLNLMNSRHKMEFNFSFGCVHSGNFLISVLVFTLIQVSRKTTSTGKDLMLVMVFSAQAVQVEGNFMV